MSEFFDRAPAQAFHACERAEAGLGALSARLQSTTGLLRTRVEVNLDTALVVSPALPLLAGGVWRAVRHARSQSH